MSQSRPESFITLRTSNPRIPGTCTADCINRARTQSGSESIVVFGRELEVRNRPSGQRSVPALSHRFGKLCYETFDLRLEAERKKDLRGEVPRTKSPPDDRRARKPANMEKWVQRCEYPVGGRCPHTSRSCLMSSIRATTGHRRQ